MPRPPEMFSRPEPVTSGAPETRTTTEPAGAVVRTRKAIGRWAGTCSAGASASIREAGAVTVWALAAAGTSRRHSRSAGARTSRGTPVQSARERPGFTQRCSAGARPAGARHEQQLGHGGGADDRGAGRLAGERQRDGDAEQDDGERLVERLVGTERERVRPGEADPGDERPGHDPEDEAARPQPGREGTGEEGEADEQLECAVGGEGETAGGAHGSIVISLHPGHCEGH